MTPISFYLTLHARTTELVERLNRTIFESTNITTLLYSMFEVYTSLTFCNVINLIFKEDLNRSPALLWCRYRNYTNTFTFAVQIVCITNTTNNKSDIHYKKYPILRYIYIT